MCDTSSSFTTTTACESQDDASHVAAVGAACCFGPEEIRGHDVRNQCSTGALAACDAHHPVSETKNSVPARESHGNSSTEEVGFDGAGCTSDSATSCSRLQRVRNRATMCFGIFTQDPVREITIQADRFTFSVTMPGGTTVSDLTKSAAEKYRILGGSVGSARLQTQRGAVLSGFKKLSEIDTADIILVVHGEGPFAPRCGCTVFAVCGFCATSSRCKSDIDIPVAVLCDEASGLMASVDRASCASSRKSSIHFDSEVEVRE